MNNLVCRICRYQKLELVLSLGRTPLANSILPPEDLYQPESVYPLDLLFCPHCSLVQTGITIPPEEIFLVYPYLSSTSPTLLSHVKKLTQELIVSRELGEKSLVVEVASNDGYLLQYYLLLRLKQCQLNIYSNKCPLLRFRSLYLQCYRLLIKTKQ